MEPGNEEPFDRGPWRKLLEANSGAPTQDMDRRILAEARRALAPHIGRRWLPVSLAASVLLAVLIVQWQLSDSAAPVPVTESDVLSAPASIAADEAAPAAAMESAKPAANLPPPLLDLRTPESRRAPAPAQAEAESAVAPGTLKAKESYAESRTPEEWYAAIEALRTSGRIKEADAELARFKSEYPGWLESHQQQNP